MEKRIINPWHWQDAKNYVQAVEVKGAESTLYISGQTAMSADGKPSDADMRTQFTLALQNLEQVIREAGYECRNIVRLNVYTTSSDDFFAHFDIWKEWIRKNGLQQATTLMEVKKLFETLSVELEATVVK